VQDKHSLVVSPLKALMSDQVKGLLDRDVPATFINSDVSIDERKTRLELIKKQAVKLVYLAPERLVKSQRRKQELEVIIGHRPSYLVVDEAHCIDKWGDSFRPSYLQIGNARLAMQSPPVLAFTTTAGIKTRRRILKNLLAEDAEVFVEGVDRPNIALIRFKASADNKRSNLIEKLYHPMRKNTGGKALIFVPTIKVGEKVQELLLNVGINAPFFHGKLTAPNRDFVLGQYEGRIEPAANILICTNAFGMGMDIPNVRLVFHWQHPSSVEDYLQEFGRAGRDGKQALAILFRADDDLSLPQYMLKKNLDNLPLEQVDKQRIYQNKNAAINLINSFTNAKDKCFSGLIRSELDYENQTTTGISKWLLNMVFAERSKKQKRLFCCDACWSKRNKSSLSSFALKIVSQMES
jgi:RecQ family ATP-dependent DNA helicase